ncbi:hypothetical protein [Actinomadura sp. NPDC049753]|uniref:hypothetical protein n=1 Tax=Actinomadura sp. NPDC049753 TaxID=3154739 RepID=UPI0034141B66
MQIPARLTGDEAYGDNTALRRRCTGRSVNYVFAVSCDHPLVLGGARTGPTPPSPRVRRRGSGSRAGDGAKGRRWYDWAWIGPGEHQGEHQWMLARRSISDPTDLEFSQCAANWPVRVPELVRVAGSRWSVEECFRRFGERGGRPAPHQARPGTVRRRPSTAGRSTAPALGDARHHTSRVEQVGGGLLGGRVRDLR